MVNYQECIMGVSRFVPFSKYSSGDKINGRRVDMSCTGKWRAGKKVSLENWKRLPGETWAQMGKQVYISTEMNFNEKGCAELSGLRLNEVAGSCEHYFVSQKEVNLSSWATVSFVRKRHGQLFTYRPCSNSRRLVPNPSSWPVRSLRYFWQTQWPWDRVVSVTCR